MRNFVIAAATVAAFVLAGAGIGAVAKHAVDRVVAATTAAQS